MSVRGYGSCGRAVAFAACLVALAIGVSAPDLATSVRDGFHLTATARAQLFADVTSPAGCLFVHSGPGDFDRMMGTGAAWFDFDRDGDLDLYVTRRIGANSFFRNNGDATFTDIAAIVGVDNSANDGAGVAVADFNNDGWLDIYLANSDVDVFYKNINGERFVNIVVSAGLSITGNGRGTSASWGDYDRDGHLDLYVTHHQTMNDFRNTRDRLFHNNGDETFTDVSTLIPDEDLDGAGFIGAWTDFDNDGDLDIFVVNDCPTGPRGTQLIRNDGGTDPEQWNFVEVGEEVGVSDCREGMGIAIGDYNRDGWLDYFYTDVGLTTLLRNEGGRFVDATHEAKVNHANLPAGPPRWSWGANFFDFNLDGWVDLFVTSGSMRVPGSILAQPNLLYRNRKDGTFANVSGVSGVDDINRARTSVFGDYDRDGDADLFVVNYEEDGYLFRNDNQAPNHHLIVELEGVTSNRDGIGSRLRLELADGSYQHYEVRSGSSLGGGDDIAIYFGLGQYDVAEELLIRWPSGLVQRLENIAGDRRIKIVENPDERAPRVKNADMQVVGQSATIMWETAYEIDNDGFDIQRKNGQRKNGAAFETIATVAPQAGMFDAGSYEYRIDRFEPGTHTFRVKQKNRDGSVEYSPELTVGFETPGAPRLSPASPNPFSPLTTFTLAVETDQNTRVEVFDIVGRRVSVLFEGRVTRLNPRQLTFDGSDSPAGVYLVRVTGETFETSQKILLMK